MPTAESALPPLTVLHALFDDPGKLRPQQTTAQVTEKAAAEFATLSASLRERGVEPEQAAHFLMRLLFCLFADDTAFDLTSGELDVLARASRLDWSSLEPAIFGALFERSLDPSKRASSAPTTPAATTSCSSSSPS